MAKSRRHYTSEFKREAVKLVRGGLSSSEVGRDIGVRGNLVSRWVREESTDTVHAFPGQGQMKPDDAELDRLRREIVKLKAERDLLKEFAAYMAKESG